MSHLGITPRENLLLALKHKEPFWLPCPIFDSSVSTVYHGLAERRDNDKDDWGVSWELKDPRSDSFPVRHPLSNPDEVDDYILPSPDAPKILDEAKRTSSKVDLKRVVCAGDNGWGLFERAWLLVGMPRLFMWFYRYPDAVNRLVRRIAEVKIRLTQRLIDEVDVDMITYGDDWGMEDKPLMSPEQWRTFIKPCQSELYAVAKERGTVVFQHSDGRVEDLVSDLAEIGVDILNIQRECNSWSNIIRDYGKRVTMWGGVSARTLDIGTSWEVSKEIEECSRLGRFGGLVLAPGHSLKYPKKKIEIMRRTWKEKGMYKIGRSKKKWRH